MSFTTGSILIVALLGVWAALRLKRDTYEAVRVRATSKR